MDYDRDLRSARTDYKRNKDQLVKWERGARGLYARSEPGEHDLNEIEDGLRAPKPRKAMMRYWVMPNNNIQKAFRGNRTNLPAGRHRETSSAIREVEESRGMSTSEILLQAPAQPGLSTAAVAASPSDHPDLVFSFDASASPASTLPLDAFIKPPTVRSTEKLVNKEYEVLDANGEAVHGRKARQILREAAANSPSAKPKLIEVVDDDDDFELV